MFEFEKEIVDELLTSDNNFKRLYQKHAGLKAKVHEFQSGTLTLDPNTLEDLKKEKLQLKDTLAEMIAEHQRVHH